MQIQVILLAEVNRGAYWQDIRGTGYANRPETICSENQQILWTEVADL